MPAGVLWGVVLNAGILGLGVVGYIYQQGRARGVQEQIDKRLTRIENYIFNGKEGE